MIDVNKPKYYGLYRGPYGNSQPIIINNGFTQTDSLGMSIKIPNGVKAVKVGFFSNRPSYSEFNIKLNSGTLFDVVEGANLILEVNNGDVISILANDRQLTSVPTNTCFTIEQLR